MAGDRARVRVAGALVAILTIAGATVSAAIAAQRSPAAAPITLRAGDRVEIAGTSIQCAVSTESGASSPLTMVCGVCSLQSPNPGTFALAFADSAAVVIKSSATRRPELVLRKSQPTAPTSFPTSSRGASSLFHVKSGELLVVGGTDVLCGVSLQSGAPALTCGLAAGGNGTFVIGSYVGVLSERVALLDELLAGGHFATVLSRAQPH
jgi:hypothetical protein